MSNDDAFGCLFASAVMCIGTFAVGCWIATGVMRISAIEANVAHWEVNAATGKTAFVYDSPKRPDVPVEKVESSTP